MASGLFWVRLPSMAAIAGEYPRISSPPRYGDSAQIAFPNHLDVIVADGIARMYEKATFDCLDLGGPLSLQ
jgi:hypothetical protein